MKEDNKKLDTKIDNLDKKLLTLKFETKNLNNSVNEFRVKMKSSINRVENRLDKIR
ncbi:hypothetical protein [Borreliella valaisiana]|uniref:Uncharacterized protein n=2 Tax=Borreliella TaxID=64895 RepID=D6RWK1_BORVA|nr:hypothetical protein [Borreliella valaisiana]EEF81985.1 conserved hypothetical protein [Borreliella valaisiana VS116]